MVEELSNIVYIGHLPNGFEEKEMKKFFNQFGEVKNVQLSRSTKFGNSRHYGWVQFETTEIAKVVAKAIDKYLLSEKLLACNVLPTSKVPKDLFVNIVKGNRKFKTKKPLTKKELIFKLLRQEMKIINQLKDNNINYNWNSFNEQFKSLNIPLPDINKK